MPARSPSIDDRESRTLYRLRWGLLPPLLVGAAMPVLMLPVFFFLPDDGDWWSNLIYVCMAASFFYGLLVVTTLGTVNLLIALFYPLTPLESSYEGYRNSIYTMAGLMAMGWQFCFFLSWVVGTSPSLD